jgi:3-oxoacyl-[acyl-carrier-protein] synthase-3
MSSKTLQEWTGAAHSRILAYGVSRGDLVVGNEALVGPIDSSDEWIRQRTGIIERHRASENVSVQDLARAAAEQAIDRSPVTADRIDAVIVSTVSFPYQTPSLASWLAGQLGTTAAAYDISAACAGFCYALAQADALIRSGAAHYVLIDAAEKLSDLVDPTDRSISFLLGDAAGAAVVGPSDEPGVSATIWGSDGEHWPTIRMTDSLLAFRDGKCAWPTLRQEGRTVFRWAVQDMAHAAQHIIDAAGLTADDIDVFVPHQANERIIDEFIKHLGLRPDVVVGRDIVHSGNTSAASIPLATAALLDAGEAKSGDLCLQIGFGAGLVYAGQVVVLP